MEQRYPAAHYVVVDDKVRILAAIKKAWGERVTGHAVKPAIAATAALLICNWFNPPGAAGIPLRAMATTYFKKDFVGGKGDRGSLQGAFKICVLGLPFIILVFLISPALSNYGFLNLFLFAELFAYGYYLASLGGKTLHQNEYH